MARARICLDCGHDFGAAAPWREPHYGLLVCTCPGCGQVWPAPRHPRALHRALAPWLHLVKGAALAFLVLLFFGASTALSESMLGSLSFSIGQLVTPGGLHNLSGRLSLAWRQTLEGDLAAPSALIARLAGGFVLGLWVTSLTNTPRQALRSLCIIAAGFTGFLLFVGVTNVLRNQHQPWSQWRWEGGAVLIALLVSFACAPLGMLARTPLDRLRTIARRQWLRKRLARARLIRHA